jgi:methylase of polypeptide subunit release factors
MAGYVTLIPLPMAAGATQSQFPRAAGPDQPIFITTNLNNSATFTVDAADGPNLRKVMLHLTSIGYGETTVCHRLGLADLAELLWRAIPIYRAEQLAVRDGLASAIDLFLLQGAVPPDELNRLLDPADRAVLVRAGVLLVDEAGGARARCSLYPVGDNLIFSDHAWPSLPHPGCAVVPSDQVMYVGTDSRWLARATVRRPVDNALDLCTGSGVHALLAAAHARRVLAVDINPRAAQCTRFNAHAAGAGNLQVAVGDLYEPAGDERFDLITANPPFVPSPRDSLQYRDGGRSGEEVQRRIIAGLPRHLAPGGRAQIVTEFGERGDEPLADRLRGWLGGAPMDIYIIRLRDHPAASYAIGHADGADSYAAFLDSVADWAGNLRTQGYTRIVSVLLAFQWSDPQAGLPWTRSDRAQSLHGRAGPEVAAALAAEGLVRQTNFRERLEQGRVRRAGPIALLDARVLGSEVRSNAQAELLGKGLPILQTLDPLERELLVGLEQPVAVAELLAQAPGRNLDREAVCLALGSLIRRGLVVII